MRTSPFEAFSTLYGTCLISSWTSSNLRPMNRLIENTVFSGFVTAWRLATWPTSRFPSFVNATTEGVVRAPSELVITTGSPPSITATTELVVPKSMPIILLIFYGLQLNWLKSASFKTEDSLNPESFVVKFNIRYLISRGSDFFGDDFGILG